ncbi:MAG: serine/threonine protein kinase [bacterium]|nr:serine/threonine protein kinase [bacterium]
MAPTDDLRIRADQLFVAALDLRPEERSIYLDEACAGDAVLRGLVERLIEGAEVDDTDILPGGGIQGPLWDGLVAEMEGGMADEETAPVGTVIGRYRLVREIGRGGMAVVFLAERADGRFRQKVALKRIQRGIDTAEVIQRFEQEQQILAQAEHPNIARLLDGGVGPEGRPYFVMEYVQGLPIDRYCDEHRLPLEQRLGLFLQVAKAVDYAHRNLVVHRDIKPTNILVTADGHVKLLDFGIAKLLDAEATSGHVPLTRSYARLMTPVYASPEQVRGQPVTTASDVYQLGLLLYQLMTGRWPYHLTENQPMAVVRAICEDDPTRPSTALTAGGSAPDEDEDDRSTPEAIVDARDTSVARLRRQLTGDLDNIALTALRKEPERRYGAVAQMIADIESYLSGRPISARADTFTYRVGKLVRRHRAAFTTALAAALLLAALAVFYAFRLAGERDRARMAAAEAGQVSAFLSSLFEISAPTRSKGEKITARQLLDRGALRIEHELDDQPELQASMMALMGNVYRELALYEEARPLLERSVEVRRNRPGPDQLELAESLHYLGLLRAEEGEHDQAHSLHTEALEIRERVLGLDHPDIARSLGALGRVLDLQGAFEQARRHHERALGILEATLGPDDAEVGHALLSLGVALERLRELEAAKARLESALTVLERHYEIDHPTIANAKISLANVRRYTGDAEGARELYEEALPLLERAYGPEHPNVAMALDSLGRLLNAMRDREAAIEYQKQALAIREAAFGPVHRQVASSLNNLGLTYWGAGDLEEARRILERSVEVFEQALDPDHVDVSKAMRNLAEVRQDAGDLVEASALFERVIEIRERALGSEHSFLARPLFNLGRVKTKLGEPAAAEPLLRRALALGRTTGPHRISESIWPRIHLGRCLTALERHAEAEEMLLKLLEDDGLDPPARRWTHESLALLYEAWQRPDQASHHRQQLAVPEGP